ncbi:CRISPR-associated endonuclease/helicase Cas3 [Spirosoma oryzae]|uniref:CRISPR-associated endonuclease/helicase Cas3 n=1 Tax=Spirosoma oryzae TaxID=1469603 RepID=A0A2T0T2S3_9BACT|nr:CRISPR-associated helicase Cas3' [Spirosoma oryzae]PRY39956.1 CRISPR-associated endonuclease/helicase Cas3 [Spirosoma oryzae]
MKEFYQQLLGNQFEPYDYQIRVAELLLSGRNVILSVPTGAGKTWASVMPFLYARKKSLTDFPAKLVYSLPLRSLANSIHGDLTNEKLKKKLDELAGTAIKIQTGEFSDDPYFEADFVFSTIDQTLSNFLCFPLPLSRAQANLNAGSLIGSYLVFDEFHLLDEDRSMTTTIGLLKKLEQVSRFCIMTATLTKDMMQSLQKHLANCEIVTLDNFPQDKPKIHSLRAPEGKVKRSLSLKKNPITVSNIVADYNASSKMKSIVLCNRVERAQLLYQQLTDYFVDKPNPPKVICLHSRFIARDRQEKETDLKQIFGKESPPTNAILISTQVIEAGMDISCDVMHTEISPINSFLQRIGRCARFGGEFGQVCVYPILDEADDSSYNDLLKRDDLTKEDKKEIKRMQDAYLPYDRTLCEQTISALRSYNYIDESVANSLIENLLGDKERALFNKIREGNYSGIVRSWEECAKNAYRDLVRDIQSVNVVLVHESDKKKVERIPFAYETVSLYKWTLVKWLNQAKELANYNEDDLAWCLKDPDIIDDDEQPTQTLQRIPTADFEKIPDKIFLNADYFGYDSSIGLNNFLINTYGRTSRKAERKANKEEFGPLKKDTFSQHTLGLLSCYEKEFRQQSLYTRNQFATYFEQYFHIKNLTAERIDEFVRLMILYHDYGKLNEAWAHSMCRYQAAKEELKILPLADRSARLQVILGTEERNSPKYKGYLAHSDFDRNNEDDKKLSDKFLKNRPPHASVGACVILRVLSEWATLHQIEGDAFDYLVIAVAQAIGRHHSALIKGDSMPFTISPEAHKGFLKLSQSQGFDFTPPLSTLRDNVLKQPFPEGVESFYLWLVRILRLCDQKATANLSTYLNANL